MDTSEDTAFERATDIRKCARQAQAHVDAKRRQAHAVHARPMKKRVFLPRQVVFVWRSRKNMRKKKPLWVGPAIVVCVEEGSDTVWVSRKGEIWKCHQTQLRGASRMEKKGVELVSKLLLEAKERIKYDPEKLGYIDVAREGPPPPEAWDDVPMPGDEDEQKVFDVQLKSFTQNLGSPTAAKAGGELLEEAESTGLQKI